ncbi:hypothetical protein [Nonomuraea lactucae]|uniref:hypothetical protein n=1 Tax=Nonomuraea lactucae TaxID=2249762 RepID=UPI0013B3DA2F|nr:hypothetical protein [Nonomuraea lactucae]
MSIGPSLTTDPRVARRPGPASGLRRWDGGVAAPKSWATSPSTYIPAEAATSPPDVARRDMARRDVAHATPGTGRGSDEHGRT